MESRANSGRPRVSLTRTPPLAAPLLAWMTLCGLLAGITLGQQFTTPLHPVWWLWALTPPSLLGVTVLSGRRRGSRLFAAGVMVSLGWVFGLLLRLVLAAALTVMVKAATS